MSNDPKEYDRLLAYYKKIFAEVDCFHFNSSVTRDVYGEYVDVSKGEVMAITHLGVCDNRELKVFNERVLQLGFIGNTTPYKGFPLLRQTLRSLSGEGVTNWNLSVYGGEVKVDEDCANIEFRGKFSAEDLKRIYLEMDLLVVPSVWHETFSLITLEALSFGVPVLVSSTVGAKDIVARYASDFIYSTPKELKQILSSLIVDRRRLADYNRQILEQPWLYTPDKHLDDIDKLYRKVLG